MEVHSFVKIKAEFDRYYDSLLRKGRIPIKDTEKGFWVSSVSDEIYTLFEKIGLQEYNRFLDLGSGDGKVAIIASLFTHAEGVEIDKELFDAACTFGKRLNSDAVFHNKDYMEHELGDYDVIFLNPDQRLGKVSSKLMREFDGHLILYGEEFHPRGLTKIRSFPVNTTPVTLYHAGKDNG